MTRPKSAREAAREYEAAHAEKDGRTFIIGFAAGHAAGIEHAIALLRSEEADTFANEYFNQNDMLPEALQWASWLEAKERGDG